MVALIVAEDAPLKLDQLDLFLNGDPDAVQVLDCEQVADLRRRLFDLPPESWCMVKKEIAFE